MKEMITKSYGDKNEYEDENENEKKGDGKVERKKSTYKWIVDNTETWFQYY